MNPLRILFVYRFLTLGGVEAVVQTRLGELARRNIEAQALFLELYGGESLFQKISDRVFVYTNESEIQKYLTDFNPHWISAIDTPAIIPISRKVAPQTRIAYEVHTSYPASYAALLDPDLFDGVSGIIVPSQSQKEFMALRMARPLPIEVVANSIPPDFFEHRVAPHTPKRPIVMWVGRLDAIKNWRGFVRLASKISARTDAEFLMVGGLRSSIAEQESLFQELKKARLISSFRWLPAVNYEDMPQLYNLAGHSGGCLVSTSWAESFGMSPLEAMAAQCPVVAPDVVGLRDLLKHRQTGWLYSPMNIDQACDLILESFQDADTRRTVIDNAERLAKDFTPANTVDRLLEVFAQWTTKVASKAPRPSFQDEILVRRLRISAESIATRVAAQRLEAESLSRQLTEQRQVIDALSRQSTEHQEHVETIKAALRERELSAQEVSAQLAAKTAELRKITSSLGWRLLSRYGRIKYRYLLPAYRFLRPLPKPAIDGTTQVVERGATISTDLPKQYDIVCFPIIDWDFRFQRPQQLLTQFARDGHRVFYIRTTLNESDSDILQGQIAANIFDLQLPGPAHLNIYRGEINAELLERLLKVLEGFRRQAGLHEVVCLVQLPFWRPLALALRRKWGCKIVYDCMDEHTGFSTTSGSMSKQEESLLRESDLVLATSRVLLEKSSAAARRLLHLPNATDFDHFNKPGSLNPIEQLGSPIIGYYGAISDWFDIRMIKEAASDRPEWQFVLIGSTFGADTSSLAKLQNVHLLGEQAYASLPSYLHKFDVACIPFLSNRLTEATNPVKFYEYLSAGKPVVATKLPELEPFRQYYYPIDSPSDFVPQVEAAIRDDSHDRIEARIAFARNNTWERRYEELEAGIKELYSKVAIIIVSFKSLHHLRSCLDSIWAKTLYPNFEVIVVDNGTQPDIVEYLETTAKTEPRLKFILNGENLGFARANNIGIRAAADSEYVVLLNDDTLVTLGWLGKMIRYLENPEVGLVGPVTNWAGNEARIDIDYSRIEDMDDFARRYMEEHESRSFDIPMLAMYCVAMRKKLLDEVGLLDEQFGIGMFEDDDFSLRVRKTGYRVICVEEVFIHHWGQASFGKIDQGSYDRLFEENRKKFEAKWGRKWEPHKSRI